MALGETRLSQHSGPGEIAEDVVEEKVRRILRLAERVGALGDIVRAPVTAAEDGITLAREVACEGMVLLENRGELPWDAASLRSLAVIGDNALHARTQGGGSATVIPDHVVSPLAGLRTALPDVDLSYSRGAVVQQTVAELPLDEIVNPASGEPGARVRFLNDDGVEIYGEDRRSTSLAWVGGDAPIGEAAGFRLETRWTPKTTGAICVGFAAVGSGRVFVDGELIVDRAVEPVGHSDILASRLPRDTATAPIETLAGHTVELRFDFDLRSRPETTDLLVVRVGTEPANTDADALIAEAVAAAKHADAALVVVGTNAQVESEGFDRPSLALPGRQDDLVAAVAAANPRTVVLVNAGAPVLMPWRKDVAAVMVGWFGGQEFGSAVASVLLGESEPGGRLTTTWPEREEDVPVLSTTPVDGMLEYREGIHIGYRAWLKSGREPAYWFGDGRGYTAFVLHHVDVAPEVRPGDEIMVRISVENVGAHAGKEVLQVYAERPDSAVDRPTRWLVGFAPVRLEPGDRRAVEISVWSRLFAYWANGWEYEQGRYVLKVGTSAVTLPSPHTSRFGDRYHRACSAPRRARRAGDRDAHRSGDSD